VEPASALVSRERARELASLWVGLLRLRGSDLAECALALLPLSLELESVSLARASARPLICLASASVSLELASAQRLACLALEPASVSAEHNMFSAAESAIASAELEPGSFEEWSMIATAPATLSAKAQAIGPAAALNSVVEPLTELVSGLELASAPVTWSASDCIASD
jgi:hypothetical protein